MFPELKNQIARLDRRRIDLDSAKDSFEKVKQAKALNSGKVQRVKSTMDDAQEKFDAMSRQLREDLPQVYSSRAGLIGYIFGSWVKQEMEMHSRLDQENEVIERLMKQLQRNEACDSILSRPDTDSIINNYRYIIICFNKTTFEASEGITLLVSYGQRQPNPVASPIEVTVVEKVSLHMVPDQSIFRETRVHMTRNLQEKALSQIYPFTFHYTSLRARRRPTLRLHNYQTCK
jgi:hypothetical protein